MSTERRRKIVQIAADTLEGRALEPYEFVGLYLWLKGEEMLWSRERPTPAQMPKEGSEEARVYRRAVDLLRERH